MCDKHEMSLEDFWKPRNCFAPTIPEVYGAVDLLDRAANAILSGDGEAASSLIAEADMPAIGDFVRLIMGPVNANIHRFRMVPGSPMKLKNAGNRMPPARVINEIYCRDGWRCRFCGVRVISSQAIKLIRDMFPLTARWGARDVEKHPAFLALQSSLDHISPHSRGGDNDPYNLVTACYPCQFGRNQWTLEEVGLSDPRLRPPVIDEWDGLVRLVRTSNSGR